MYVHQRNVLKSVMHVRIIKPIVFDVVVVVVARGLPLPSL